MNYTGNTRCISGENTPLRHRKHVYFPCNSRVCVGRVLCVWEVSWQLAAGARGMFLVFHHVTLSSAHADCKSSTATILKTVWRRPGKSRAQSSFYALKLLRVNDSYEHKFWPTCVCSDNQTTEFETCTNSMYVRRTCTRNTWSYEYKETKVLGCKA